MATNSFGVSLLEKHGRGKFDIAKKEELSTDLRNELLKASPGVAQIPGDVIDKEIARFLEFGYASENNLDRFRRRVFKIPSERASDAASLRSACSIAYSQPNARVGKAGSDSSSLRMPSISLEYQQSPQVRSARLGGGQDWDGAPSPISARSTFSSSAANGCKWSTVAKLNALREVQEADEKKAMMKQKQLQLKSFLDEQVQAKTAITATRLEETRQLRNQADLDRQRLSEEERQKKETFMQKVAVLKEDREQQVMTSRIVREIEKQERLEAGRKLAQEANFALEAEQQAALDKKQREKVQQKKLIEQWHVEQEEHEAKKKEMHAAERQAVLRLQEDLRKEEEQKALEVQKALADRSVEFQKLAYEDAKARQEKKLKREARIAEETKQLEHVTKANKELEEKQREKSMKQRAERVQNVEFLFSQMDEHQRQKMEAADQKRQQLMNARTATQKYSEEERQRFCERRTKNVHHRLELEEQIASRVKAPPRVREDLMSTSEACINKNLVEQAGRQGLF